jgi:hypothetical protein
MPASWLCVAPILALAFLAAASCDPPPAGVRLEIEAEHSGEGRCDLKAVAERETAAWLRDAGVAAGAARGADAPTLFLRVRATTWGAVYGEGTGGSKVINGASVDGVVRLAGAGPAGEEPFHGTHEPPSFWAASPGGGEVDVSEGVVASALGQPGSLCTSLYRLVAAWRGGDSVARALTAYRDPRAAGAAAAVLASSGDPRAVAALAAAIRHGSFLTDRDRRLNVRLAAMEAAAGRPREEYVRPALANLRSRDWMLRARAASLLGALGDASIADDLRAATKDRDESVRREARAALKALGVRE